MEMFFGSSFLCFSNGWVLDASGIKKNAISSLPFNTTLIVNVMTFVVPESKEVVVEEGLTFDFNDLEANSNIHQNRRIKN